MSQNKGEITESKEGIEDLLKRINALSNWQMEESVGGKIAAREDFRAALKESYTALYARIKELEKELEIQKAAIPKVSLKNLKGRIAYVGPNNMLFSITNRPRTFDEFIKERLGSFEGFIYDDKLEIVP